jgi:hypothetical protein
LISSSLFIFLILLVFFSSSSSTLTTQKGEHHYYDRYGAYGPSGALALIQARDQKKKELCAEHGIVLVEIPFW